MRCQFIALLADGASRACRQTATCEVTNGRIVGGEATTVSACERHARLVMFHADRTVKRLGYGLPLRRRTDVRAR